MHSFNMFPFGTCLCLIKPKLLLVLTKPYKAAKAHSQFLLRYARYVSDCDYKLVNELYHSHTSFLSQLETGRNTVLTWPLLFSQNQYAIPWVSVLISFLGNDEQKCLFLISAKHV